MEHVILVNSIGRGGAERQISYISTTPELKQVICIEPLTEYPIAEGKQVILTQHVSEEKTYQKFIQVLSLPFKLRRYVRKETHVICFLQLSYILGYLLKRMIGCTYTITVRTNPWGFYKSSGSIKLPFRWYEHLLKHADYIVANSVDSANQINARLKTRHPAIAIHNGYDIETIDKNAATIPEDVAFLFENRRVLISVGRLYDDKGQWHLIRIFHALKKKYPDITLVILGKGPLLESLCSLCGELNLSCSRYDHDVTPKKEADVYFIGFNNNPYALVKHSFLFLFPSLFEGLPNSPLEALICSVPVLMADCPTGPREILFPEGLPNTTHPFHEAAYGMLFPPFDGEKIWDNRPLNSLEQYWVDGCSLYFDNPEKLEASKKACVSIREKYSLRASIHQWKQFLSQVENEHAPSYK